MASGDFIEPGRAPKISESIFTVAFQVLLRIAAEQLRVGMFFERAAGSWVSHGLWRTGFMVADENTLATIVGSGVQECWINTAKGMSLPRPAHPETAAARHQALKPRPAPPLLATPVNAASTLASEWRRAARVCEEARAVVKQAFSDARLGRTPNVSDAKPVVEQIVASVLRHSGALAGVARSRGQDDYTHMHSVSVCALMVALARELGFDDAVCHEAGLAGLFHDVGKAHIPPEVLDKPGKLTDAEFDLIRTHPAKGHATLVSSNLPSTVVLDVCLHHHERIDGTGYPGKLSGHAIPLMARMGAVCDVYDAVTSQRSYKAAWDPAAAIAEMATWHGHFDRSVLAAFIRTVGVFPPGSLVRLASGRLAVVVECKRHSLRTPLVRVFFCTKADSPVPTDLLDLSLPNAADSVLQAEPRKPWAFLHLAELAAP